MDTNSNPPPVPSGNTTAPTQINVGVDKPITPVPPQNTVETKNPINNLNKKTLLLIISASIIVFLIAGYFVYGYLLQKRIVIYDQPTGVAIDVDSLTIKKGGYLMIDLMEAPSSYLVVTEYLPPGTYKDFSLPYFVDYLEKLPQASSYTARAFIYEDKDLDMILNIPQEKLVEGLFGKPLVKKFNLEKFQSLPKLCSSGLIETFEGSEINRELWSPYIWNKQEGGILSQSAANYIDNTSTTFYSKDKFSGDLQVDTSILSLGSSEGSVSYGVTEVAIFTPFDRVFAVRWHNKGVESYLTAEISKQKEVLTLRQDVPSSGPVNLRIKRVGTEAKVSLQGVDGSYQEIWNIPDIATDDVYLGLETVDMSQSSQEVIATFDNLSLSCPSL